MKEINAVFERAELTYAASLIARAVTSNSLDNESNYIYIEANADGKVVISATNTISIIKITIKADVISEGAFGVPGRLFTETIKKISADEITIEQKGTQVLIGYLGGEIKLPATEYRKLRLAEAELAFSIEPQDFKRLLEVTQNCAAKDNTYPALRGINFIVDNKTLYITASDGFRIAHIKFDIDSQLKDVANIIVPVDSLKLISQTAIKDKPLQFAISNTNTVLVFRQDGVEISTALLAENYSIKIERIKPKTSSTMVTVKREAIIQSIERATILAPAQTMVSLTINEDSISVGAVSSVGALSDVVAAKNDGKDLDIAFNGSWLLEILKNLEGDEVTIKCNSEVSPMLIEEKDCTFVLLPIRKANNGGAK